MPLLAFEITIEVLGVWDLTAKCWHAAFTHRLVTHLYFHAKKSKTILFRESVFCVSAEEVFESKTELNIKATC